MQMILVLIGLLAFMSFASAEQAWVALSKVGGLKGEKGQVALFRVKESLEDLSWEFRGAGADAFTVSNAEKGENSLLVLEITFRPTEARGFYSAELVVGVGEEAQLVQLRGIATKALEGKNEPPLQEVLEALGADVNAGGVQLSLDTKKTTIGDSVAASQFKPLKGENVRIAPLARFSPSGETPFGLMFEKDDAWEQRELGALGATTTERPDAHQSLRPPLVGGQAEIEVPNPPERFGLFYQAHKYTSLTLPGQSEGATIKHTARIYPVSQFAGQAIDNAYIVGFEEASNGDYQDAVFLIEGVKAVK